MSLSTPYVVILLWLAILFFLLFMAQLLSHLGVASSSLDYAAGESQPKYLTRLDRVNETYILVDLFPNLFIIHFLVFFLNFFVFYVQVCISVNFLVD